MDPKPLQWWHDGEKMQRLIDDTLMERLHQSMQVQAAIFCTPSQLDPEARDEYEMHQRAWFALSADIDILQPQSSVPF